MASVLEELKKHGHYSTRSEEENQEAKDLHESGLVNLSCGGSTTVDGKSITIFDCKSTEKLKKLIKNNKI